MVMASNKKKRKKKENLSGSFKTVNSVASCYGCGAPLQTQEVDAPGFVDPVTYELKKKHRQLKTIFCGRCRLLSHGHMITTVGGHGGYAGGKQFVTAEELRDKLCHLRHEKALIVKLLMRFSWGHAQLRVDYLGHVRQIRSLYHFQLETSRVLFSGSRYLLEQSLYVDNLFVFVLVFKYFKVPFMYQVQVQAARSEKRSNIQTYVHFKAITYLFMEDIVEGSNVISRSNGGCLES